MSSIKYRKGGENNYEDYDVINEVAVGKNYYGIDTGGKHINKLTAIELGGKRSVDTCVDNRDLEKTKDCNDN